METRKVKKTIKKPLSLVLECENEELTPEQKAYYDQVNIEFEKYTNKFKDYVTKKYPEAEVIYTDGDYSTFEVPFGYRVEKPTTGQVIVSTSKLYARREKPLVSKPVEPRPLPPPAQSIIGTRTSLRRRAAEQSAIATAAMSAPPPLAPATDFITPSVVISPVQGKRYQMRQDAKNVQQLSAAKAFEYNAIGGLLIGTNKKNPMSRQETDKKDGDLCEITFGKQPGKTYPSLVVSAKPHLGLKIRTDLSVKNAQERATLDAMVKSILVFPPAKFTEWLLQKKLLKSQQVCPAHINKDGSAVKMKLGLYNDVSRFTQSGGYVWIGECCPNYFVSVYNGSIFEGSTVPPTTILKLIYHWACQTNVQNIVQWVKVDNVFIKNFFTLMRAVCTQALHEKFEKLGGPRRQVELGVISLGTTTQDGSSRQVKVEILGVLDWEAKKIRLSAVEPVSESRSLRYRFLKILEPLKHWVYEDTTIVVDGTIDVDSLRSMGYKVRVIDNEKAANSNIMDYLRKVLPKMLQNTLSLLSRPIIQQFLDELTWREVWGQIAPYAFHNIMVHLAEQTEQNSAISVVQRLQQLSLAPFKPKPFSTSSLKNTEETSVTPIITIKRQQRSTTKRSADTPAVEIPAKKPTPRIIPTTSLSQSIAIPSQSSHHTSDYPTSIAAQSTSSPNISPQGWIHERPVEMSLKLQIYLRTKANIEVDAYYYGMLPGNNITEKKSRVLTKCCICLRPFWDSMVLMKHLLLHCQTRPRLQGDIRKAVQCNQCFIGTNSYAELKDHMQSAHAPPPNQTLICRICEKFFNDKLNLIYHMHKTHVAMELPYRCGVCNHRSSSYKQVVEHFSQMHKSSHLLFCPYCLKVVSVLKNGSADYTNIVYYVNHIQKHQVPELVRKCVSCRLSFFHRGLLKNHIESDHRSMVNEPGIIPYNSEFSAKMPFPSVQVIQGRKLLPPTLPSDHIDSNYYAATPNSLKLDIVDNGKLKCVECEANLTMDGHFSKEFKCLKCSFTTSCEQAMHEHTFMTHKSNNITFISGKPLILSEAMYCMCGYSSCYGFSLARHLASCDKRTAYPTENAAKVVATTVRRIDMAKLQIKMKETGETHSMLNVLGLMRKSPEPGTDDGASGDEIVVLDDESNTPEENTTLKPHNNQNKSNDPKTTIRTDELNQSVEDADMVIEIENVQSIEKNKNASYPDNVEIIDSENIQITKTIENKTEEETTTNVSIEKEKTIKEISVKEKDVLNKEKESITIEDNEDDPTEHNENNEVTDVVESNKDLSSSVKETENSEDRTEIVNIEKENTAVVSDLPENIIQIVNKDNEAEAIEKAADAHEVTNDIEEKENENEENIAEIVNEDKGSENDEKATENEEKGTENEEKRTENEESGTENDEKGAENEEKGTENDEKEAENEEKGTENEEKGTEHEENGTENDEKGAEDEEKETENDEKGAENEGKGTENEENIKETIIVESIENIEKGTENEENIKETIIEESIENIEKGTENEENIKETIIEESIENINEENENARNIEVVETVNDITEKDSDENIEGIINEKNELEIEKDAEVPENIEETEENNVCKEIESEIVQEKTQDENLESGIEKVTMNKEVVREITEIEKNEKILAVEIEENDKETRTIEDTQKEIIQINDDLLLDNIEMDSENQIIKEIEETEMETEDCANTELNEDFEMDVTQSSNITLNIEETEKSNAMDLETSKIVENEETGHKISQQLEENNEIMEVDVPVKDAGNLTAGSLIAELEGMINNTTEPAAEFAPDFITDLIGD